MASQTIFLASQNPGKVGEFERLFANFDIVDVSLALPKVGSWQAADEKFSDLAENAKAKAQALAKQNNVWALADDSGLFVDGLNGFPGTQSARWLAGTDRQRNLGLLAKMKELSNRSANYQAYLCLCSPLAKKSWLFTGSIDGKISDHPMGEGGFGYDSIFIPAGQTQTFAQLPRQYKNLRSHRALATQKLLKFLKKNLDENPRFLSTTD